MTIGTETLGDKLRATLSSRFVVYTIAILVRSTIALFFIDRLDGPVFFDTAEDILLKGEPIYFEGSLQFKFNYFPLAYFAILPGQAIYFLFDFDNVYLQRLFLKLPLIIADIIIAIIVGRGRELSKRINNLELFILFNPVLIYSGSVKGQFDVIPVLLILLAWRNLKQDKYLFSGVLTGAGILFKQYCALFSFFVWIQLMKQSKKNASKYFLGHLIISLPILLVSYVISSGRMVYHAVEFHLHRDPAGYSLTNYLHSFVLGTGKLLFSTNTAIAISDGFLILITILMVVILLYIAYRLWINAADHIYILQALVPAYLIFFALNRIFLFHYLPILF
ncbi:MAG: glycosyltransferase 87 family protein, partial [Candidatus Kariarchaeaceae archaeon]